MYPRICIAEIPIYGTDEKTFDEKWFRHIEKAVVDWIKGGWEKEAAERKYGQCLFPRTIWKYAQIIGFLKIELSSFDVWFEAYVPLKERYCYNQTRKLFPQNLFMIGTHFRIEDNMDNDAIRMEIYNWIREINNEHLKGRYLDVSVFDVVSKHIDFRKILEELRGR